LGSGQEREQEEGGRTSKGKRGNRVEGLQQAGGFCCMRGTSNPSSTNSLYISDRRTNERNTCKRLSADNEGG
jgi:hypothetical protein